MLFNLWNTPDYNWLLVLFFPIYFKATLIIVWMLWFFLIVWNLTKYSTFHFNWFLNRGFKDLTFNDLWLFLNNYLLFFLFYDNFISVLFNIDLYRSFLALYRIYWHVFLELSLFYFFLFIRNLFIHFLFNLFFFLVLNFNFFFL